MNEDTSFRINKKFVNGDKFGFNYLSKKNEENYILASTYNVSSRKYDTTQIKISELHKFLPAKSLLVNRQFVKIDPVI
jgi:hypothetical protein